jgi:mycothiol synthase
VGRIEAARRNGTEEAAAIAALVSSATEARGHLPIDDDTWRELAAGRSSGRAGFLVRAPGATAVIGYAQLDGGPDTWRLAYVLDPDAEERLAIGRELCRAALGLVAAAGGGAVRCWVRLPSATDDEITTAVGMDRERDIHQMRRPLPVEPDPSPQIATRAFQVGLDEPALLALNNRAFAGHPEQGGWSTGTLLEAEREPWFDPGGLLVHEIDGAMLAFCWTKVHDGEPPVGEIWVLGVDPEAQHRGIGQAMLRAGLVALQSRGLRTAMLYVDAGNLRAVTLYRAAGFSVDHDDRAYLVRIEPAR